MLSGHSWPLCRVQHPTRPLHTELLSEVPAGSGVRAPQAKSRRSAKLGNSTPRGPTGRSQQPEPPSDAFETIAAMIAGLPFLNCASDHMCNQVAAMI